MAWLSTKGNQLSLMVSLPGEPRAASRPLRELESRSTGNADAIARIMWAGQVRGIGTCVVVASEEGLRGAADATASTQEEDGAAGMTWMLVGLRREAPTFTILSRQLQHPPGSSMGPHRICAAALNRRKEAASSFAADRLAGPGGMAECWQYVVPWEYGSLAWAMDVVEVGSAAIIATAMSVVPLRQHVLGAQMHAHAHAHTLASGFLPPPHCPLPPPPAIFF